MGIDPLEVIEDLQDDAVTHRDHARLNAMVAVPVAVLATFLGIRDVKDNNIVQGMQAAQADKIDDWGYYQARNIREEIARSQNTKKEALKVQAEQAQKTYDALNYRDDQFDLASASVAIALLAVTALTHLRSLFFLAMIPGVFGLVMGVAGLGGFGFHPDALIHPLT